MNDNPYHVGADVAHDPAQETHRHMTRLIAYDVTHPKRLRRVAKVCQDFGVRVEKSVFECDLPDETFDELMARLLAEIDEEEDMLLAYCICAACTKRIRSAGSVVRPRDVLVYFA